MQHNTISRDKTSIFKLIICSTILLLCQNVIGYTQQNNNYHFRHIGPQDGLAHNSVFDITQDSKGFIWVATPNGLQRYDGSRFLNFNDMLNNPYESNMDISKLYMDGKKNCLWISKKNKTERLELTRNRFTVYEPDQLLGSLGLKYDTLTDENGMPWLLGGKALFRYDSIAKKFLLYVNNLQSYAENVSNSFITHPGLSKRLVAAGYMGLLLFDEKTKKVYSANHNPHNDPLLSACKKKNGRPAVVAKSIMRDSHHNIWIASWGGLFYRYNADTKKLIFYSLPAITQKKVDKKDNYTFTVNSIYEDDHGTIWICTDNAGLLRYNPEKDNFDNIFIDEKNKQDSRYNYGIYCIFQDREGNIWLGTDKGISIFNPYRQYSRSILHEDSNPSSLPKSEINCFIQTRSGDILIGTWGGGITVYDSAWNFKKNIQFTGPFEYNLIWSFIQNDDGDIWAGCQHGYIHIYNPITRNIKTIHPPELHGYTIWSMAKDVEGNIYMGLHDGKIAKWNKRQNKFFPYNDSLKSVQQIYSPVFNIFFDSKQRCWVSTETGLKQFDTERKIYSAVYVPDKNKPNTVSGRVIEGVEEYDDTTLVIGTVYGGLNFFNTKTRTFTNITMQDGLPANTIYALKKDARGYLWFTTDYGLYKFKPSDKKFIRYNLEPGVINSSFKLAGFYPLKDGRWVTSTATEIICFSTARTRNNNSSKAKVEIAGFKIFDSAVFVDSLLDKDRPIYLTYKQNFITIEYADLYFLDLAQSKYYYRLSGVNSDWVNADTKTFASYTNLAPGEYTFSVRSDNGDETTKVTSLKIIITPPFWQTVWFKFLIAACIILLFYLFIKWRIRNIKSVAAEKMKVQQLKAESLKNKLELEQIVNYFSSSLIDKNTIDDVLWDVAKNLIGRMGFVDCMIYLWNSEKTKLIQRAGYGPKGSIEEIEKHLFDVSPGEGVVGYVMQTKEQVLITDTSKDVRYRVDEMERLSEIYVPIIYNDELIGVIDSEHHQTNFFNQQHIQVLSTIAALMANKIRSIESEKYLQQTKIEMFTIKEKLTEARLETLQSQLSPHFIFNCLNSIDNLIQNNEKENATLYLSKFAKLMRSILETSKHNAVPCWKDMETLKVYLELEELRLDKKFTYQIDIAEEIINGDYKVPPLVIQPFVENAIHHGLLNKTDADKKLFITVSVSQNHIHYTIQDNGVGRMKAAAYKQLNKPTHESMGMQISTDRINLFNRNNNKGSVKITDLYDKQHQPAGTKVEIEIINQ